MSIFQRLSLIFFSLIFSSSSWAHQPRLVDHQPVEITHPEISQAFYGQLTGQPVDFTLQSDSDFELYVGLLVPDLPKISTDISATIIRVQADGDETIAYLDGAHFDWKPFYEKYGQDHYLQGPELGSDDPAIGGTMVQAGQYRIVVSSPSDSGKYILVTGYKETFPLSEILKTLVVLPRLKAQFFDYTVFQLAASVYVWGYLLTIFLLAFVAGFIYRLILRKISKHSSRSANKNLGAPDRWLRACIAIGLFVWAVLTTWSPMLLFFSGFTLFEALFSWCILYAALGKTSCPI